MRLFVPGALAILLLFASCRRERRELCRDSIIKRNGWVYFIGFSAAELDTVLVVQYSDEQFLKPLDSATVTHPVVFVDDTAYAVSVGKPFIVLSPGRSAEIRLAGASTTFRVSRLIYTGGDYHEYYSTDNCRNRNWVDDPTAAVVNGDTATMRRNSVGGADLFLRK